MKKIKWYQYIWIFIQTFIQEIVPMAGTWYKEIKSIWIDASKNVWLKIALTFVEAIREIVPVFGHFIKNFKDKVAKQKGLKHISK